MKEKVIRAFLTAISLLSTYSGKDEELIISGLGFTEAEIRQLQRGEL